MAGPASLGEEAGGKKVGRLVGYFFNSGRIFS